MKTESHVAGAWSWRGVAALGLGLLLVAGCRGSAPTPQQELEAWAAGPARWLLQAEERRAISRVRTHGQAAAFRATFWGRRDPQGRGGGPGSFQEAFDERVAAADALFGTEQIRGSLTPRGRAIVVLGPPPRIERRMRGVLTWVPGTAPGERQRRSVPVEIWIYRAADLAPSQARLAPLELVFLFEKGEGTDPRLSSGGRELAAAAAALVLRD